MGKFYFFIWIRWVLRISLCSFIATFLLSSSITLFIYIKQGMPPFNSEIAYALLDITKFWFTIIWSFVILVVLFRSVKYIFNHSANSYSFVLLECQYKNPIEIIGYGDLVKVWRRWFMLLIWLIVVEMIFSTFITYIFSDNSLFYWFNSLWLYIAILIAGYFSFILLSNRCKRVKVIKY